MTLYPWLAEALGPKPYSKPLRRAIEVGDDDEFFVSSKNKPYTILIEQTLSFIEIEFLRHRRTDSFVADFKSPVRHYLLSKMFVRQGYKQMR